MALRVLPDHLLLDRSPNIGPLISRWELGKFKNSWNKSFRTSTILTVMYQQFLNLLISQRDMSGPRLGTLPINRWSEGNVLNVIELKKLTFCFFGVPLRSKWLLNESNVEHDSFIMINEKNDSKNYVQVVLIVRIKFKSVSDGDD
jgi:hypothetical protein